MKQGSSLNLPVANESATAVDVVGGGAKDDHAHELQLKAIQRELWRRLHERLKRTFEERLLSYVDRMIEGCYPGYCSNDGKVVDRRLAQRIGVDPALISRLRAGDGNAMTRMSHFLALMNLCGVSWTECAFLPPQKAVLDAVTNLFPLAQEYVGSSQHCPPDEEQILVLYFASRLGLLATPVRNEVLSTQKCEQVIELVAAAECDALDEPVALVTAPRIRTPIQVLKVVADHGRAWLLLDETFPFLGKPNRDGHRWGIF